MYLGIQSSSMTGTLCSMAALAIVLNELGERIPIWNTYIGGGLLLVFFGTMVTHDYSMGKNVITVLGTIVGMVFIMFLAVLFTTLVGKIVGLITNIVDEIQYRL